MEPAREELAKAIQDTEFKKTMCPIYQNVAAFAVQDTDDIKTNLIYQLTAPVKWTQSIQQMIKDGATEFIEVGQEKTKKGWIKKIEQEERERKKRDRKEGEEGREGEEGVEGS